MMKFLRYLHLHLHPSIKDKEMIATVMIWLVILSLKFLKSLSTEELKKVKFLDFYS